VFVCVCVCQKSVKYYLNGPLKLQVTKLKIVYFVRESFVIFNGTHGFSLRTNHYQGKYRLGQRGKFLNDLVLKRKIP
jgi:hypothetical protein